MDKKSPTTLERLQRTIDSNRPNDDERERVADQLITQDQVRRLDPGLKKLVPLPPARKGPPSARELVRPTHSGPLEPAAQGPARLARLER